MLQRGIRMPENVHLLRLKRPLLFGFASMYHITCKKIGLRYETLEDRGIVMKGWIAIL